MATILAHITIRPGMAARFEALARSLYASTHELEPRVRRYEYWRGADENSYYSLLSFDSFTDFLAHQTSDHHEAASPELGKMIAAIRLEWVDPIASASPLAPTNNVPLASDASDLERLYSQRFAAQVASWWGDLRA
jgi:quinol monooxygenase YgiN